MAIQSSDKIGYIIRNSVLFNFKNLRGGMMNPDSLLQSVQNLFTLLEQRNVGYVMVGGVALLHYVEGRNTQDLDLLMAVSSLKKLPELKISAKERFFLRADYDGLQIDVLLTQNPLFKRVFNHYARVEAFLDRNIPIASVEGLLLLKLYALPSLYRQGNFARVGLYENDVAALMHYYQPDMAVLLQELSRYMDGNDLTEIKNILADLENRSKRFQSRDSRATG